MKVKISGVIDKLWIDMKRWLEGVYQKWEVVLLRATFRTMNDVVESEKNYIKKFVLVCRAELKLD